MDEQGRPVGLHHPIGTANAIPKQIKVVFLDVGAESGNIGCPLNICCYSPGRAAHPAVPPRARTAMISL